jgi:hypothetical protein
MKAYMTLKISRLSDYTDSKIIFNTNYLIEIYDAPIISIDSNDQKISTAFDLIRLSHENGYDELYMSNSEIIKGIINAEELNFSRSDFLEWQLKRINSKTLYHFANKIEIRGALADIFDYDQEVIKNPDYSPEEWLNENISSSENRQLGIGFIDRLRVEKPNEFYKILIDALTDGSTGVLSWLEASVDGDEDINEIRHSYSEWSTPLVIVNEGEFNPYIDPNDTSNIMMDDFYLTRSHVRNYDEGEPIN